MRSGKRLVHFNTKLRANDEVALERARVLLEDALKRSADMSHIGFLTLPDSSAFLRKLFTIFPLKDSHPNRHRWYTRSELSTT